ncbi:serine/threonine-protein kinase [Salinactinospora qingdaonensis]|uniref:non-specific serine/threonine protein kinase n=1 Tax=Salinactinospora qingdaonensis TaxID=702744 RepID=A0ABP7GET9_9ACTN
MSTDEPESAPDHLLAGRYRMYDLIGQGGMGRVWRGTDELLDRPVAIKELIIPSPLPQREVEVLRTRMMREARSAAQLSHPSIITVFDVVESDERPWIVMELVRGTAMSKLIKERTTLEPERVAAIGVQLVAALSVAHQHGVVHRDVKPGNVLIADENRTVLTDFGIARLPGSSSLTTSGNLLGSPSFLAPEQARGETATPASDMWALGATLYNAVEGAPPFHRSTAMGTLSAIITEEVPAPQRAGPLRPVIEALLDKDPEGRLTVEQAGEMLRDVVAHNRGITTWAEEDSAAAPAAVESEPAATATPPTSATPVTSMFDSSEPPQRRVSVSGKAALVALSAVVAIVLAVSLALWLGGLDSGTTVAGVGAEESSSSASPSGDPSASPSPSPSTQPQSASQPSVAGVDTVRHEDPTGFALDVPEGWSVERRQNGVFFDNPQGGYLQIDQTDDPGPDAEADWRNQEGAISSNFSGYERIAITELDQPYLDGYISAADWEFTFDGANGRMHAVNRAFHTEEKGYALFLVSTEEDWETNRALLEQMTRSFVPAA